MKLVINECRPISTSDIKTFENRVLRRIFGPKRDEVIGGWRKLQNEEIRNLYPSLIIRIIKSRKVRSAGHVARMGKSEMSAIFWLGILKGRTTRKTWA
jgi:hypothetical protein